MGNWTTVCLKENEVLPNLYSSAVLLSSMHVPLSTFEALQRYCMTCLTPE